MKLKGLNKVFLLILILLVSSCQSEYTKLVKTELASGKLNDSIFHGLEFGQSKDDFFKICWNLNNEGIATHGPTNSYVQTILSTQDSTKLTDNIRMLFYAKFNSENMITSMDVKFSYVAWSPWNKDLLADKLLPKVQDTLMKWYPGNPFIKVKNNILVKVDGNRQIQLAQESDRDVSVLIEDLAYKYNNLNK
jgi:hypothetical protein